MGTIALIIADAFLFIVDIALIIAIGIKNKKERKARMPQNETFELEIINLDLQG